MIFMFKQGTVVWDGRKYEKSKIVPLSNMDFYTT